MRALRIAGIALGAVVVLAGLLAFCAAWFAPGYIEAGLVRSAQEKHRTLRIAGGLTISWRPRLLVELHGLSLSERDSAEEFVHADVVRIAVDAASLLTPPFNIAAFAIDGLKATVIQRKDGTFNIDDLLIGDETPAAPLQLDIAGIRVAAAQLAWRDEKYGNAPALYAVDLTSGRIRADTGKGEFRIDNLALSGRHGELAAGVALAGMLATRQTLALERLAFDLDAGSGSTSTKAALAGRLTADFVRHTLTLDQLAGTVDVAHPRLSKPLHLPVAGSLRADLGKQSAHAALTTHFDGTKAALSVDVVRLAPLALDFDVDIDRLDLDRMLAPQAAGNGEAGDGLPLLQDMRFTGTVKVGSLVFANIHASNLKFRLNAAAGRIEIAPQASGHGRKQAWDSGNQAASESGGVALRSAAH
jgi:AsmA protein